MDAQRHIAELVAERRDLASHIAALNRQLEQVDAELFSRLESALSAFGITASPPPPPPKPPRMMAAYQTMPMPLPPLPVQKAAVRAIEGDIGTRLASQTMALLYAAEEPLTTSEIFERLRQIGVEIPGKDPKNNLSAHLSRSKYITRKGKGWWLAEKQEPPEGGS